MSRLAGLTVLVVEDEGLIAMDVEAMLCAEGCAVVGPVGSVAEAGKAIAEAERLDGALLDVNLSGETVFPIADELARRAIPFVLVTGHSVNHLPTEHRGRPILSKPYTEDVLIAALLDALQAERGG